MNAFLLEHRVVRASGFVFYCVCDKFRGMSSDDYTLHIASSANEENASMIDHLSKHVSDLSEKLDQITQRYEQVGLLADAWEARAKHIRSTVLEYPEDVQEAMLETALDFEQRVRDVRTAMVHEPEEVSNG